MQTELISQVVESRLSKQGKTTTTGIFEGQPENALVSARGFVTPTGVQRVDAPIDAAYAFNTKQTLANTYLEHLQREKKI
jgi:hypothetical protein